MPNPDIEKKPEIDWVHLPADTHPQSLWDCLHDAALRTIHSDLLNRTVIMAFDAFYIREYHKLPEGTLFNFLFEGVASARVTTYTMWPGKFAVPKGSSREEEGRLIKEYQSKWREESLSWNEFESLLKKKKTTFDILDTEIVINENHCALQLSGHINDKYHCAIIRASKLTIQRSDGQILVLDDFSMLGQEYWKAFSEGKLRS